MRLQEALETTAQGGFWRRLIFEPGDLAAADSHGSRADGCDFHGWIRRRDWRDLQLYGGSHGTAPNVSQVSPSGSVPVDAAAITGIRSVTQEPGSNQVSIKYDTISTQEAQGSLNDQRIQQLLLFAARNNYNSGVRMDSVDVLTQTPNDSRVREVLMYSLAERYQSGRAHEGARWAERAGAAG